MGEDAAITADPNAEVAVAAQLAGTMGRLPPIGRARAQEPRVAVPAIAAGQVVDRSRARRCRASAVLAELGGGVEALSHLASLGALGNGRFGSQYDIA